MTPLTITGLVHDVDTSAHPVDTLLVTTDTPGVLAAAEDGRIYRANDGSLAFEEFPDVKLQVSVGSVPRFLGYDSDDPETQQVIWTGDAIPHSADGLTAIPAGVVEIEDTKP